MLINVWKKEVEKSRKEVNTGFLIFVNEGNYDLREIPPKVN